jgi:hypothetical protein
VLTGASATTTTAKDIQITYHNAVAQTVPDIDRLTEATKANSTTFVEYDEAAMAAVTRDRELAEIVRETAAAHDALKASVDAATAAYTANIDPLKALEAAQIAFRIATGQMTEADLLQTQAKKELLTEFNNGILTMPQLTAQMIALTNGTLTADEVLNRTTATASVFRGEVDAITAAANAATTATGALPPQISYIDSAAQSATTSAQNMTNALNSIPSNIDTTITVQQVLQQTGDYWGQYYGMASGGSVNAGQPYIVGERGPELFVPDVSGEIVPDLGSMSHTALPDAGETRQVTITQQFYGKAEPEEVRDATVDGLRLAGVVVVP